jgi:hypothetical protein
MNVLDTAQNITNDYTALGSYIGVCTGVPGNSHVVNNEANGGSPAYSRAVTTWSPGTNGTAQGSDVILNLPPGTYPYMIMCQAKTGETMIDWCLLPTPIEVTEQEAVNVTPTATFA